MEFLQPFADLFGISPEMLAIIIVLSILATIGWYILKAALKITAKMFATGCAVIAVGIFVLFVGAVVMGFVG